MSIIEKALGTVEKKTAVAVDASTGDTVQKVATQQETHAGKLSRTAALEEATAD